MTLYCNRLDNNKYLKKYFLIFFILQTECGYRIEYPSIACSNAFAIRIPFYTTPWARKRGKSKIDHWYCQLINKVRMT